MAERDPEELADRLEQEADDLERHSRKLAERTTDVSQEWQRKRSDPSVPGAPQPTGDDDDTPSDGTPSDDDEE